MAMQLNKARVREWLDAGGDPGAIREWVDEWEQELLSESDPVQSVVGVRDDGLVIIGTLGWPPS